MTQAAAIVDRARLVAIADRLRERYGAQRVVLYGSVARGESTEHSDIDLLVIRRRQKSFTNGWLLY